MNHLFHLMYILILYLIGLTICSSKENDDINNQISIAIVGGGLGGSSSAFYLRQMFGDDIDIDIYESSGLIGGRVRTSEFGDEIYEVGGTILHPDNFYMANFTQMLGLHPRASMNSRLGLYNGEKIVLTTSDYNLVSAARFFWRYGRDIFKLQTYIDDLLDNFSKIYSVQDLGMAFTKPENILEAMSTSFLDKLHQSSKSDFLDHGFSELFIDELIMGALRTNYGQATDIHAFVGAVSVAGALPGLWAVHGGNHQIPERLLQQSNSNVLYRTTVTQISLSKNNSYTLTSVDQSDDRMEKQYDIVIVASPLHEGLTDIKFDGFPEAIEPFPHRYHKTVATFVRGVPNFAAFGYSSIEEFPDALLSTDPDSHWNSIGRQVPVDFGVEHVERTHQENPVWKIFSQRTLTGDEISELFADYKLLESFEWLAYPHYSSHEINVPSFELHDNLYYTSAIELCASAMEMSVISARNVALLAHNRWFNVLNKVDINATHVLETMAREEL